MSRIKLRISPGAALLMAGIYFFDAFHFSLLIAVSILVHEAGHLAALRLLGARVTRITLQMTGFAMEYSGTLPYSREAAAAFAGPASSALIALIAAIAARRTGIDAAYELAGLNVLYCAFNLLPVLPLDGGRILCALLARLLGIDAAERVSCVIGCIVIFAALIAGAYAFAITKSNFTLLLAAMWLLIYYCKNGDNSIVLT